MPLTPRAGAVRAAVGGVAVALAAGLLLAPPATAAPAAPRATDAGLSVSVVVPITARSGGVGLLDAEYLETTTSPFGTLTRELDEVLATSATIALDPMIPASIRALGSAAPESALAWLARLERAANEVFLLAWSDADLAAFARGDALGLATPPSLDFALDPGAFGPAETPAPSPTPTATPSASATPDPTQEPDDGPPPLPSTEELLAWPDAIGPIAWPAEGSSAAEDLPRYRDAGYEAVLLSSADLSETSNGLADVEGTTALVSDSAASALLRQAAAAVDDATREAAIARLGLALDGLAAAHPGRSVVLTLDRATSFAFPGLEEAYAALLARPSTTLAGLAAVLSGTPEAARVVSAPVPDHVARMESLLASVAAEDAFATILADPLDLVAPRRLRLLSLLAVPDLATDWPARADDYLADSREILDAVQIVDNRDLLVTSQQTAVVVRVANALEFPVTVRIDARPLRPRIRIDSPVEVTVEPGSSKNVRLEAQAITNGEVVVVVSLSSPSTGAPIGRTVSFNADLQAQWETVGLVVGAVVVLVFAAGIARNVVTRRRGSAAGRAAAADDGGES